MATDKRMFHWADYLVFCASLFISVIIGVYYAVQSRKKASTTDYLMGGKDMGVFPVAASFVVSSISAIFMQGVPSETYAYGIYIIFQMAAYAIALVLSSIFYQPVYHRLGITSVYEYVELRFGKGMRIVCSLVNMIQMVLYASVALYAPSIALSQATRLPTWACILIAGVLCTCYTTFGGFKTVLWTDTVQWGIMVIGLTATLIKGSFDLGGLPKVMDITKGGGRLSLTKVLPHPLERHTICNWVFAEISLVMALYASSQFAVQRFCSVKTINKARLAMLCAIPIEGVIVVLTTILGCIAYVYYRDCDPYTSGRIESRDQILALLVVDVFEDYPGMAGVFLSSIMSAALSTLSSVQHSFSALFLEDLLKPLKLKISKTPLTEKQATISSKVTVFSIGVVIICISILAARTGKLIMQLGASAMTLVSAPSLGVFTLGLFVSFSNNKGAFAGLISGMAVLGWIIVGALSIPKTLHEPLPVSTRLCPWKNITYSGTEFYENSSEIAFKRVNINDTIIASTPAINEDSIISKLYQISFTWYALIGWLSTVISGIGVSLLSGGWNTRSKVKAELLFSFRSHGPPCCTEEVQQGKMNVNLKQKVPENEIMLEESCPYSSRCFSLLEHINSQYLITLSGIGFR